VDYPRIDHRQHRDGNPPHCPKEMPTMTQARFVTEPVIHPIGQMALMPEGINGMLAMAHWPNAFPQPWMREGL
jgi:hypothetical protein